MDCIIHEVNKNIYLLVDVQLMLLNLEPYRRSLTHNKAINIKTRFISQANNYFMQLIVKARPFQQQKYLCNLNFCTHLNTSFKVDVVRKFVFLAKLSLA